MIINLIPLMFGAAAVIHCLFLISVLLRLSSKLSNRLLAAVLLFLSIRMGGCIAGLIYSDLEFIGLYLGAIAFALVGPLHYFYLHSLWNPAFRLLPKHVFHLISVLLILIPIPILTIELAFGLYLLALLTMIVYVVSGFVRFKKNSNINHMDSVRWKWTRSFNVGVGILLALFLSQSFFFDSTIYQGIIIGSTFILYFLTLVAVKNVKLFMYEPRSNNNNKQVEELGIRIEKLLMEEEIYTDPLMSVSLLAKHLNTPSYLVSLAVNSYSQKSFPELINTLRIQKAEQLLLDPSKSHFTIESIAYESGFSTLSAFYTSFKKVHHKTPNKFRTKAFGS